MDFKHEPSDPYVGVVKTELDVVFGQKEENYCPIEQKPFKNDHLPELGYNNCESQATECFVNVGEIKQETVEYAVPKIEYKHSDLPVKIECKQEFDIPDVVDVSEIKQEVSDSEYLQTKIEKDLNTHIDLPTLKNESNEYSDNFAQPCSSKYTGRTLKSLKTVTNFVCKRRKKLYPCLICKKNFPSSKSRSKHISGHFGKNFVVCEFCGKLMTKLEFFRHYYFVHVVQNRPRKVYLKINTFSSIHHTNEEPFKCDICFKQFKRKCDLDIHLVIHTNEKPFKCAICSKGFKRKADVKDHLNIHTNEKPFKCNICSKGFRRKKDIKTHLIIHTDQKIKCDICFKEYKGKSNLRKHLKAMHTNAKPFKCDICFIGFKRKRDVKPHLLSHTDERTYKCDICFNELKSKFGFQEHLKIIHNDEKPFKCDICFKQFKRKSDLNVHLIIHTTEKPFKCDICCKEFKRMGEVKRHLKIHAKKDVKPFKCDICFKQLKRKYCLQNHLKVIHCIV